MDGIILSPEQQRKLQNVQLIALLEVDRICKKHNLRYFLAFGTLLGAVRHKGFIPWDDDVDITMPRDDMCRFISICKSELSQDFFIQTPDTDANYYFPIIRLRVTGTKCVEKYFNTVDMNDGIFVDIYPCDNVPDSQFKRWMYKYLSKYLIVSVAILARPDIKRSSLKKRLAAFVLPLPLRLMSKSRRIKLRDGFLSRYNKSKTKDVVVQDGMGLVSKYVYPCEFIESIEYMDFEGWKLPCSKLHHNMLSQMYGKYMELPPVEKRCQHHGFLELDFGKYDSDELVTETFLKYREI